MEIFAARKTSKTGSSYLVIEARAEWGTIPITFDAKIILQVLPYGIDHRTLTPEGIKIGKIES